MADNNIQKTKQDDALQMLEIEKAIKTFYSGIAMKRKELRDFTETIKETLEGDKVFAEQKEKINEVKIQQKKVQEQIMSVPSVLNTKEEMKDLRDEIRELQKLLSKNLIKYYELTQKKSITMGDGETYDIKQSAKLVKQGKQ